MFQDVGMDLVMNGVGNGDVANKLLRAGGDVNVLRPYIGEDGRSYYNRMTANGKTEAVLTNTPASLRFQDWRLIDDALLEVAKPELRLIGDLRGANLQTTLPNGIAHTVFSYEDVSDVSAASISMNPNVGNNSDRPVFNIYNLPLPIFHKDYQLDLRQMMAAANGSTKLDLFMAKQSAIRVAEAMESLAAGVLPTYSYGGGTIYGLSNYTYRLTKTLTAPSAAGWTPSTTVNEVLAMRQQSKDAYHNGPWMLYVSPNWDVYMDADYSQAKGDNTLRDRLRKIRGIIDVRTLDWLRYLTGNPYTMLMIHMSDSVIRVVVCQDLITVQWPSNGGLMMNFKVLGSMVLQLRADQNQNTGIVHGSVASP